MEARVWVYAKVYVHDRPEMLDWLVVSVLPRVRERLGGARWFFLRYFDTSGVHLRVRFEVPAADARDVQDQLARTLTVGYAELDRAGFNGFDWFMPRLRPAPSSGETATAVVADVYVPEHGTYGARHMTVAEDLFHRSSELAAAELAERHAAGASYAKRGVLAYMDAVRAAFVPDRDEEAFWTAYRERWLGPDAAVADAWRAPIVRQAERVAATLREPFAPSPRAQAWDDALRDAAARYGGAASDLAVLQFAHLTNNRLGITLVEESYLAQLLLARQAVAR
jgi:hypothetical protein